MKNKNVVVKHKGHSNLDLESHHMSLCNDEILNQVQDDDRKGFTLIEVLIVVLIIAILSAVAVPQYQKAVMKSRYSALMPIAKSLANGNEAYYMDKGQYATSPTELDVAGQDEKYPDGTKVDMSRGEYSYVLAKRDNLPLNYLVYQKHSEKFADNIHCEADENNPMAQEVCQGLGGELISGSQTEGYLTYVLSGTQGANDKLPSSLTKLAANLQASQCVGKTNCTATIQGDEVVVSDCGTGIYMPGLGNRTGCKKTKYNNEGTSVETNFIVCGSTHHDGVCYPSGFSHRYESVYSEDGNIVNYKVGFTDDANGNARLIQVSTCLEPGKCSLTSIDNWQQDNYSCPTGQRVNLQTFECETY